SARVKGPTSESLSPQVVSAAKLSILNPNEFDLRKMRIEQVIEGVVQPFAPATTEQRLARMNEFKARDSTNESVSIVASVSAASAKVPVFALLNVDTLSDAKAEQERDELKLKLKKFQTSSKNLSQLLASQTNDKTRLGYDNQVFTSSMFDCDEMFSSESDVSMPASPVYDRYQPREGYHSIPPPYTRTFMPPKPDLVFHDAPTVNKTVHTAFNVELSSTKPDKDLSHSHMPSALIIEDWVSDSEDESEAGPLQNDPTDNLRKDSPKSRGHSNSRNTKACFVCKSLTHLIKENDYYEKKMVQTPAKNHAQRGNHQHYEKMTHPNSPKACAKTIVTKPHSPPRRTINHSSSPKPSNFPLKVTIVKAPKGNPQHALKDKAINGGYVAFGGNLKGGKISGKGKIRTGKLDFDDVYFVKDLKFNLFCVLLMCDKKNSVLFTDTECIVLSSDFKLPDENHMLLRVPRENNMYNVDLKNIIPTGDLTSLFSKETLDESNIWHRRLGQINFKTMNKLVKGNLVRRLPSKVFKNNRTCVACKKGKRHRASCKTKPISQPLQRLHIDLFRPTFVKSLNKKSYCLVVTDNYSRFSWVFFLDTKDETGPILKTFITGIENQLSLKVKIIRSDNETKFKNHDLNQFYGMKGINREFSVAKTAQQNGIAKRKNMTLIETARTMLADSLLPILFWAKAVNTVCYVHNK
nr:putative ribonuclease H-like domain-containing protein [Tanacetum cinerariifolium]